MNAEAVMWAVLRATVYTSSSAILAQGLLTLLRVGTPRVHRTAWFLVVVQAWLLAPWVLQIETTTSEPTPAMARVETAPLEIHDASQPAVVPNVIEIDENRIDFFSALVAVWLLGIVLVAAIRAAHYLQFLRQLPAATGDTDAAWQLDWQRLLRASGLKNNVELRVTSELGPLVCFVPWRYLLVLPHTLWCNLARRERNAILRHELAHLVRGDLWWSLAIGVLSLPQWFNPLVWLAVRRFDEAGEWACDDWVSRGRRNRELTFARSLLATAEYTTSGPTGTASAQGGQLARRVRRLVARNRPGESTAKKLIVVLPLALIVAAQTVRIEYVQAEEPLALPTPAAAPEPTAVEPASYYVTPPQYVIEPPDILLINAVKLIPKSPHMLEPFDSLLVRVLGALPDQPIADAFAVDPDGTIDLGPTYGKIEVTGLTVDEAQQAIKQSLEKVLEKPQVSVSLAFSAGAQQIQGKHLVGPDGRVNLGIYGTVYVRGMTVGEAREAIEKQLSEYLQNPQVVVDVASFNSKKYYVITRTPGRGDQVASVSLTGNDRVLDALSKVGSLPEDSSNKIWISRPAPNGSGLDTILPVRWDDISAGKSTSTNYELLPGDRLFIVGGQPASEASDPQANVVLPPNKFLSSPYADMEVKSAPVRLPASADRVEFSIDILVDRAQALAEYDAQRGKSPFLAVDAETIRPALRALTGYGHIRMLSSPKLVCQLGETATIELKADDKKGSPGENLKLSLSPQRKNGGMFVQLKLDTNSQGKESVVAFGVAMEAGQTVLVPVPSRQNDGKSGEPLYLAISRSKFGSESPASNEATYYRYFEPPTAE